MELADSAIGPRRKTGRPLSFDREAALEQAMLTFWRHGYETTSIVDLTTAMGVTAPSLYAAFGDKQRLFLEAVRRYAGDPELIAEGLPPCQRNGERFGLSRRGQADGRPHPPADRNATQRQNRARHRGGCPAA